MVSRKGDPSLMGYSRQRIPDDQIVSHFWSKVDKNGPIIRPELGPCWVWMAGTNGRYPVFSIHRRRVYAHRFVCELAYGPLAPGQVTRHKCDNGYGGCVRPEHVEPGTQKDNVQDARERGRLSRTACFRGHAYAEVGVYIDGPDSKTPGKRQCAGCNKLRKGLSHQCAGVVTQRPSQRGSQCGRMIPVDQQFCYGHRP